MEIGHLGFKKEMSCLQKFKTIFKGFPNKVKQSQIIFPIKNSRLLYIWVLGYWGCMRCRNLFAMFI